MVGDASFGIIKNSVTETNITSDEGGYVGGIAGYSKGKIYNCAAISDLKGSDMSAASRRGGYYSNLLRSA